VIKRLFYIVAFISFFLTLSFLGVLALFYHYGAGLPDYQHLAHYKPPIITRFYANDGRVFAEFAWEKRIYVPIKAIPKRVIQSFLAAEDKNFYQHSGIDIPSIISAAFTNIGRLADSKRPIGASTITQQVAKNFLLADIAHAVSYERKIKEAILAFRIENAYSKDHILELFLNEIYLGLSSYGVAAAALNYFNKSLDELTIAEVAYLAGLPKAPNHYHPLRYPEAAKIRRNYVLRRMAEDGYITAQEAKNAMSEPIILHERKPGEVINGSYFAEEVRRELVEKFGEKVLYQEGLVVRTSLDPILQEHAQQALKQGLIAYDRRHGWRGPLLHFALSQKERVIANKNKQELAPWILKLQSAVVPAGIGTWHMVIVLDLNPQGAIIGFKDGKVAQIPLHELQWARKYINEYSMGPPVTHPKDVLAIGDVVLVEPVSSAQQKEFKLCQIPIVSGGMVVMDPHTGRVLAMQGGFCFERSQFNRATQAMRQIGSTFKTFAYLAALERGLTPSTLLYDGPFSLDLGYGLGIWSPHNYEKDYLGNITLRRAFELSRNLVTVRMVHDYIGMKYVKQVTERLGVVKNLPLQLATVLGAAETTLLKVTAAYAMIANGGKQITPTLLERVQDRQGKNLYVKQGKTCEGYDRDYKENNPPFLIDQRPQVIDPATAYQMVSLLQGAVERGTAKKVSELKRPLAGKTGTSNDYKDTWFLGFSPDLVVGVFIGFDTPRDLGSHETGARVALPVFKDFMEVALKNKPAIPFRVPPGIKLMRIDALTGLPASGNNPNIIFEAFKPDTEESSLGNPPPFNQGLAPLLPNEAERKGSSLQNESLALPSPPENTLLPSHTIEGTGGLY
jgi:penicillin-binding protein 1A